MTMPPLTAGTVVIRGITFVRVAHLVDWLEEVAEEYVGTEGKVVAEIRAQVEQIGR